MGLFQGNFPERGLISRRGLGYSRQVDADDRGDLGVASRGAPVGEEYDGQPVPGDLHRAEGDAVGDYVSSSFVLDPGPLVPVTDPVGLVGGRIFGGQEGPDTLLGEGVVPGVP